MRRAARAAVASGPHLARAALVAALAISVGVFHVWARTRVLAAGYVLGGLQNDHVKLESEHDRLRIEVETLRSPAAVERFARTRLGMAPPEPGAVSAAGPLVAQAGAGRADGVGVGHRPGPAEPSRRIIVAALGPRRPEPESEPDSGEIAGPTGSRVHAADQKSGSGSGSFTGSDAPSRPPGR